jgi:hypothetical protein
MHRVEECSAEIASFSAVDLGSGLVDIVEGSDGVWICLDHHHPSPSPAWVL